MDCYSSDSSLSETELGKEEVRCLFCNIMLPSVDSGIMHLKIKHNFNMFEIKKKLRMDEYSYIQMINFIRRTNPTPNEIKSMDKICWNDEKFLKPVKYDAWLTYDFEGEKMDAEIEKEKEFNLKYLKEKLLEKEAQLKEASEIIKRLQLSFKNIIDNDVAEPEPITSVANISIGADEGYFNTYAHFSIHHEMLSDSVRTLSYKDAILKNSEVIKGKTVLDVGCGTSILSMFASSAGAEKIIGIDNSEIIYKAMDIIRVNNCKNIELVKGRLEDTELPLDKFDIIISEWMGYLLIFEGMLDTIIYARDRHLKLGGILMPNRCNISLIGYGDEERHTKFIGFWDSVYGYDMSTMKKEVLQEPLVENCKSDFILTEPNVIIEYNLYTVNLNYSNISVEFKLNVVKDGALTAIIGYFDTFFDLPTNVSFSTSPYNNPTHWKQVVFFIEKPIKVKQGEIINGKFQCRRNIKDMRSLQISIKIFDKEYFYKME